MQQVKERICDDEAENVDVAHHVRSLEVKERNEFEEGYYRETYRP